MSCSLTVLNAAPRPGPAEPLDDWLATQTRVVEAWIDRLIAEGGDVRLIALLDQHAAFLREAGSVRVSRL